MPQIEQVGRSSPRRRIRRGAVRGRRDAYHQGHGLHLRRVAGQRVGSQGRRFNVHAQIPKPRPVLQVGFRHLEVGEADFAGWRFQQHVVAGFVVQVIASRQRQCQLFEVRGQEACAAERTRQPARFQDVRRNADLQIFPNGYHACQPFSQSCVPAADVVALCRQQGAAAADHPQATLATGASTAAGGRKVDAVVSQGPQQTISRRDLQLALLIQVDGDLPLGHQALAHQQNGNGEQQHDGGENGHGCDDLKHRLLKLDAGEPGKAEGQEAGNYEGDAQPL